MQNKLVPEHVLKVKDGKGYRAPVIRTIAHAPGAHPSNCPLVSTCTAVEVVTEVGSRWYGVEKAWIGSDLRMHVSGFDPRFEEMARWEDSDIM